MSEGDSCRLSEGDAETDDCRATVEGEVVAQQQAAAHEGCSLHSRSGLRRAAPGLPLDLLGAIVLREGVRKSTGPNNRLALDRHRESP